jgi:hypothetical protein
LDVDSTPLLLTQPVSVIVSPGDTTNFSVTADGPSLAYQWWHENSPIASGTAATFVISNATAGDQGNYFVVVSNFAGTTNSQTATLAFDSSALNILLQPKDQTAEIGYPATFSVVASGVPPLVYQWQREGVPISGATSTKFTIPAVTTNDVGNYRVVITNGYRMVTSSTAHLYVTPGAVPPRLAVGRAPGNIVITFDAEAGRTYRLLYSTNFANWSAVATNSTSTAGPLQFTRSALPAPQGFFRVVTP